MTASKIQDILSVAPRSIGTTSPAREFEIIKHYKRLIDKAEKCVNDLMAEFNSVITTVTGIGNRLGAVILAEIRIFMPLIILLNYKLSLDWILLFISQVRLI
ncbi:degenerate transposase [Streptococcus pneumoniae]|nr:hypothetical protein [Streptococcus pneumoniae]CFA06862.1 degenerate transposase [Streptococcus pneumoniae]CGG12726.1 degenerate transposase [Streptococcus pneumoniae]CGG16533.1 degenerate transposase [Streptococcus pneumoniae]CGG16628.1 degenerate transposase [Streptococcus pneumoniae]CIP76954.1 degenerate transposase [Streptococcus pneumoniae]